MLGISKGGSETNQAYILYRYHEILGGNFHYTYILYRYHEILVGNFHYTYILYRYHEILVGQRPPGHIYYTGIMKFLLEISKGGRSGEKIGRGVLPPP
jgi:hypothetical protein